jgi:hypothetical protein
MPFRTMQAYGGTYEFDGRTVKHHIDMSWNQTWTGTTQIRDLHKDGDKLIYTTRPYPFPADGKMSVVTVVWQKSIDWRRASQLQAQGTSARHTQTRWRRDAMGGPLGGRGAGMFWRKNLSAL